MSDKKGNSAFANFSITITLILILALVVLFVGIWQDWFAIRTNTRDVAGEDEWRLSLVVNPQQMEESADELGQEIEKLAHKTGAMGKTHTIEAVVESVNTEEERLVVIDEDGEPRVFDMAPTTELKLNQKDADLADLSPKDKVIVLVRVNEGKRSLLRVDAERPNPDVGDGDAGPVE